MRICIITAALPPQLDGIGDHTACLASKLAESVSVRVVTALGRECAPIRGVSTEQIFSISAAGSFWRIPEAIETHHSDWVLLQYNPFSYGRWGLNLHLPLVMRRLRNKCPHLRFALLAHENFVPVVNWKFAVMTTWQRWQLWTLGRTADLVLFTIEPWVARYRHWFAGTPVAHLPVGSSIPYLGMSRAEARHRLGVDDQAITLGLFGTAHASRLLHLVRAAVDRMKHEGREMLLLYMGPHAAAVRNSLPGAPVLADGPLPPEEISRRFGAVDIALAPFVDGVSTRRTTLMTGLQHGIATVGTRGPLTDRMLLDEDGRSLILADVRAPADFVAQVVRLAEDDGLRRRLGNGARALYEREFSWERVSGRLLGYLAQHSTISRGPAVQERSIATQSPGQ